MMASLGLGSYRFSVSWSRVQPAGAGPANPKGLDFYQRLVDELLVNDIEPWLTLYHWDLPQTIENAGGWPARDTAARFAEYASIVHGALGDRVRNWTTLNEPWCSAFLGYAAGVHAPGRRDPASAVRAAHHLMLGHGLAVDAIRAADSRSKGITSPVSDLGRLTARRRRPPARRRPFQRSSSTDPARPLSRGRRRDLHDDFDFVRDDDLAVISRPLTLLGINYYSRHVLAAPSPRPDGAIDWRGGGATAPYPGSEAVRFVKRGAPVTAMKWEIDAPGLAEVLQRVHRDYPEIPLYITENGAAFDDRVLADGSVDDNDRRAFIEAHLRACLESITAGVPLRGYFAWSLMDNFEWAWGYHRRFGLVYVDYLSQRRIPKASALWYADVIRHHGLLDTTPPAVVIPS
jgi:beta-glucosidase